MIYRFYDGKTHSPASNFFASPFEAPHFRDRLLNGEPGKQILTFPTVEHYYQAAKFTDFKDCEYVRSSSGPGESKRRGRERRPSYAPTWEGDKFLAMRWALEYKFAPGSEMAEWLIGTGGQGLIEGNNWDDTFWGVDDGVGHNWLGFMLMARRAELSAV